MAAGETGNGGDRYDDRAYGTDERDPRTGPQFPSRRLLHRDEPTARSRPVPIKRIRRCDYLITRCVTSLKATADRFEIMPARVFGTSGNGLSDRLLSLSKPVTGSFYFAPAIEVLAEIG
jgi:hypothetical protein